jgi:hypothetical protein
LCVLVCVTRGGASSQSVGWCLGVKPAGMRSVGGLAGWLGLGGCVDVGRTCLGSF